jgi:hypothetical protein
MLLKEEKVIQVLVTLKSQNCYVASNCKWYSIDKISNVFLIFLPGGLRGYHGIGNPYSGERQS